MSADTENSPPQSPPSRRRRSSLAEMFTGRPSFNQSGNNAGIQKPVGTSMASALAQQGAQQESRSRRLSVTAIGLSGSPTHGSSAFDTLRGRASSTNDRPKDVGSAGEENAVDEDGDSVGPMNGEGASRPSSPTAARRMSLGARAYRDMRVSTGGGADTGSNNGGKTSSSPPSAKKEGFDWSESLRHRAQRSSISAASGTAAGASTFLGAARGRSTSVAEQPPHQAPKQPQPPPQAPKAPDHFQERILKGDFYMD